MYSLYFVHKFHIDLIFIVALSPRNTKPAQAINVALLLSLFVSITSSPFLYNNLFFLPFQASGDFCFLQFPLTIYDQSVRRMSELVGGSNSFGCANFFLVFFFHEFKGFEFPSIGRSRGQILPNATINVISLLN